jgi:hypothetical protein
MTSDSRATHHSFSSIVDANDAIGLKHVKP